MSKIFFSGVKGTGSITMTITEMPVVPEGCDGSVYHVEMTAEEMRQMISTAIMATNQSEEIYDGRDDHESVH